MTTKEPYFNLVKTGASSWSAVPVQNDQPPAPTNSDVVSPAPAPSTNTPARGGLFGGAINVSRDWTKNFIRIAVAVATLLLERRG